MKNPIADRTFSLNPVLPGLYQSGQSHFTFIRSSGKKPERDRAILARSAAGSSSRRHKRANMIDNP
jgi:hypothetical protein